MGGRGSVSYSEGGGRGRGSKNNTPLSAFAVASLNTGIAGGTTPEKAIERFREQMMDKKVEYSAYIDDNGYFHSLGSTGKEGSTKVAPISTIAKQKGVSTIVHNHPHGGSDGRKWGGTFSKADLAHISKTFNMSGGKINKIIATSKEGTYTATVKKKLTEKKIAKAYKKADKAVIGKTFQSEKAMWRAVNSSLAKEFGKIGIDIKFDSQTVKKKKLITQKIGTY